MLGHSYSRLAFLYWLCRLHRARQVDIKGRTFTKPARHGNVSAALLNDSISRRKPKAGSFYLVFRCEERFKDVTQYLGFDAMARVLNGKHGVGPALDGETEAG